MRTNSEWLVNSVIQKRLLFRSHVLPVSGVSTRLCVSTVNVITLFLLPYIPVESMPSSVHSTCYTGPSCVIPAQPIHAYYYKNSTPAAAIVSSVVPTPPTRNRAILQESGTQNMMLINTSVTNGRYNSPAPQTNDFQHASHTRSSTHGHQADGTVSSNPPDLMSISAHSPSPNYHYWPNSPTSTGTGNANQSVNPTVSTYCNPIVNHSGNTNITTGSNNSHTSNFNNESGSVQNQSKLPGSNSGNRPLWKERPHVGRYSLIRTIGKGNFAKVKLAQHLTTGMQVAVKVIDKTLLNQSSLAKLFREVRVLKKLNHPNIIKLLEVIESERHLYLVMEYASGGEVFDYLVSHGKMKESVARLKFRQIVSAVQYCHQKMVVHRDLKAENLLLDEDLNVKIADFGFSNYFSTMSKLDTFCGSPPYAAPELFLGRKYDGPEVDVWSLGVILYTLVSGTLPFDGKNLKELRERVLRGTYRVPFYMTHECELLLKKMLVLNPVKRLPLNEVMRDPWLNTGFDVILRPFAEPPADYCDPERIEVMVRMGFKRSEIQEALTEQRFNNITATYILLARYDPKVHGRLPGLSNAGSSRTNKPDNRSFPMKFSLNGTTQVVNGSDVNGSLSCPTNAVSSSSSTNTSAKTTVRTVEEASNIRNALFVSRNSNESTLTKKDPIPVTQRSAASVSSATTTNSTTTSSSSTDQTTSGTHLEAVPNRNNNHIPNSQSRRPHPVRRSATTAEPKATKQSGLVAESNMIAFDPRLTAVTSAAPSQGPPVDIPPMSLSLGPQTAGVAVHPPSVTTAHLTLTNGPPVVPLPTVRLSTTSSPPNLPRSRASLRSSSIAAPLARSEDDSGVPNKITVDIPLGKLNSKDDVKQGSKDLKTECSGVARSNSSCASTSGSCSNSDSDVYDRDWGSGSSGSIGSRRGKRRTAATSRAERNMTSVILAAAPNCSNTRQPINTEEPDVQEPCKPLQQQLHFDRASIGRKWSIRNAVTSGSSSATPTTSLSIGPVRDQRLTDGNMLPCPSQNLTVTSTSSRCSTDSSLNPSQLVQGIPPLDVPDDEIQPQTKPRGLLRGPPNAADILSESNPFRIAADNLRPGTVTSSSVRCPVSTQNSIIITSSSVSRAFSPPSMGLSSMTGATRRPFVPPPLATNAIPGIPNRTSYAYHSLRLPSSTTTTTIAMGKGDQLAGRSEDYATSNHWSRIGVSAVQEDGMATPTPGGFPNNRDLCSLPFNRNLPERSTIQHVPTGRARERLEGPISGPRLVRHPGTHSIANQSMRLRSRSPSFLIDNRDTVTPRPVSPDDLSISSVTSSGSALGDVGTRSGTNNRREPNGFPSPNHSPGNHTSVMRQSNTLGSPVQSAGRQRPVNSREGQNNGGLNSFFRTITTRISRSKLFRRSAILQPTMNCNIDFDEPSEQRSRLDAVTHAPTLELDRVVMARASLSPNGAGATNTVRMTRSRSGVTPHRPASHAVAKTNEALGNPVSDDRRQSQRKSRTDLTGNTDDRNGINDISKRSLTRKPSRKGTSSRDSRSHSAHRPTVVDHNQVRAKIAEPLSKDRSPIRLTEQTSEDIGSLNRSKMRRSMRYVLWPFARWPLEDVMIEVKRSLNRHSVDFEEVGEHKLHCVYGDPAYACRIPSVRTTPNADATGLLDAGTEEGVVHWEMEVGKLSSVGMNGIRFRRINGSMVAFKQIAKKLAADLRF